MKISLVVAQGVHAGKVIPIVGGQFLIGRDPHCNLRPASPSISKQHCGIFLRGDKLVVVDYGSTNGTHVNGMPVTDEQDIKHGDKLKAGPLEFEVRVEATSPQSTISNARRPVSQGAAVAAPVAAKAAVAVPQTVPAIPDDDPDTAAAMLLAMDDDSNTAEAVVPDGATVMDVPQMPGEPEKKPAAAPKPPPVDSSKAAADILSKYMRRPRT